MKRIWLSLFVLLFSGAMALAQQASAELGGKVTDQSGAVIPGATVTVVNQETGTSRRQTISGDDGNYLVTNLPPGVYTVTVEMPGFKKAVRSDIRLSVGRRQDLNIGLQIGEVSQTVTVSGAAPIIETTSKEVGGNVERQELTDLPSVNRNFIGFIGLLPGVVPRIADPESFGSDSVSINGQDNRNANFLIDGIADNDDVIGQRAGGQARVALETVEEFQVVTSQFDAEFGSSSGAVINAITKSGTNHFHGSGFGFFQNAVMDANSFFNNANGVPKADTSQQQWGGTIGGPIYTDVAHFFFSFERVSIDDGRDINIPARPEFDTSTATKTRVVNTLVKGDIQLSENNQLSMRWIREASPQGNQIIARFGRPVTLSAAREEADVDQTWAGSLTSTFGPRFVNQLRIGVTRENVAFANPGFNGGTPQSELPPTLVFQTFVDQQNDIAQGRIDNSYQIDEVGSWYIPSSNGDHNLKFGVRYNYVTDNAFNETSLNGIFFFPTDQPFNPADPTTYPNRLQIRVGGPFNFVIVNHNIGGFFQDKWQVHPRLTLNLGFRWDKETVTDDNNNFAPRLGFAWNADGEGKTVVRGGFGFFYDRTTLSLVSGFRSDAPLISSFTRRFPLNGRDTGPENGQFPTDPTLVNGPVVNQSVIDSIVGSGTLLPNPSPTIDNPDRAVPYIQTVSIGVERELTRDIGVSVDYLHSDGRDQLVGVDLNAGLRPSPTSGSIARPDPTKGSVTTRMNIGNTTFDALQIQLHKRFSHQYSFRVSYSLGSTRGTTSGSEFAAAEFQHLTDFNMDANQGPTDFDHRHNLVVAGTWYIPRTTGLAVSGVFRGLSGGAFTLLNSQYDADMNGIAFDPLPAGTYSGRGSNPYTVSTDGMRNGARGPAFYQFDSRVEYKRTLGESVSAAFTFEAFNLFNHTNFNTPSGNFFNRDPSGASSINFLNFRSTAAPRMLQLGFRIQF